MTNGKIKVLLYGDSPTACTGFGTVARELILRLQRTGRFEFMILGINYFGDPHEFEGTLRIFPVAQDDMQGRSRIGPMMVQFQPDVLFTVGDYDDLDWFPNVYLDACRQIGRTVPWVMYTPVDGSPLHAQHALLFRDLITHPVTCSQFGAGLIHEAVPVVDVPVIYHGVDTRTFYRMDDPIRAELRSATGLGDHFVVLSVGVNQLRKQYGTLLEAFAEFRRGKEDAVRLVLHTDPFTPFGYDIRLIARHHGFADEILFTNPQSHPGGVLTSQMGFVYNLADVAVFPHCGEGFGLCHLEALACQVPVIAHGVAATPEIVRDDAGVLVPTEQVRSPDGKGTVDLTLYFPGDDRGKRRPLISMSRLVEAMELLYGDAELRQRMGRAGRRVATQPDFSWDSAARRFEGILVNAAGGEG